jgi:hypothetical protein
MKQINVVILGAGFISDIHVESYQRFVPEARLVGVFARDFGWLADLRALLNTQGSPCIGTISTDEAAQLGDHETIEAMCANGYRPCRCQD